jgi:hypothetical protein
MTTQELAAAAAEVLPTYSWGGHQDERPGEPSVLGYCPDVRAPRVVVTQSRDGVIHCEVGFHREASAGHRDADADFTGSDSGATVREAIIKAAAAYAEACQWSPPAMPALGVSAP